MEATDFGPYGEREFSGILLESTENKEVWYARMLDRYHEMYRLELDLKTKGASTRETDPINLQRDRLHKQLERLGRDFGRSKDVVLGDVIGREGNLGEYGLPEFGLMTPEQGNDWGFIGFDRRDMNRGQFLARADRTREQDILQQQQIDRQYEEDGATTERAPPLEPVIRSHKRAWLGEYIFQDKLARGQVAVIFGTRFTVDIQQEPVTIEPPGYREKFRRAAAAAETLRAGGMTAHLFVQTVGAYHDTTTVIGIAVPAAAVDLEVVGLLRRDRARLGVRTEDMDAELTEREYLERLHPPTEGPAQWEDMARALLYGGHLSRPSSPSDGFERLVDTLKALAKSSSEPLTPAQVFTAAQSFIPKMTEKKFGQVVEKYLVEHRAELREAHAEFLAVHQKYFGTRTKEPRG